MTKPSEALAGYRTYIIATMFIAVTTVQYLLGDSSLDDVFSAVQVVLGGGAGLSLRASISDLKKTLEKSA